MKKLDEITAYDPNAGAPQHQGSAGGTSQHQQSAGAGGAGGYTLPPYVPTAEEELDNLSEQFENVKQQVRSYYNQYKRGCSGFEEIIEQQVIQKGQWVTIPGGDLTCKKTNDLCSFDRCPKFRL